MVSMVNMAKSYSEVYAVINELGDEYKDKLPSKVLEVIEKNRDENYNPKFSKDESLQDKELSHEAVSLLSALNLQYWCESSEEKDSLKRDYIKNTEKENEKYSADKIFVTTKPENVEIEAESEEKNKNIQTTEMIEYKENFVSKMFNMIKNLLKRKV